MLRWLILSLCACTTNDPTEAEEPVEASPPLSQATLDTVDPIRLKAHVDVLADDSTGGRIPGSVGHAQAMDYLVGELMELELEPLGDDGSFLQTFPSSPSSDSFMLDKDGAVVPHAVTQGTNLVALIPGKDPDREHEHILVMAHYDHLGVTSDGEIYNGAFDDAAGVAVALELARMLSREEARTDRSIVLLLTDEEEFGLDGSGAWIEAEMGPGIDVVGGVSVDPVGRPLLPGFAPVVVIGSERSPEFQDVWRQAAAFAPENLDVVFMNRDVIPVFASDQDNLYQADPSVPAVWFVNPGFSFYHTTEDTPITIDYRVLVDDVQFLATAISLLGNTDARWSYEGPTEFGGQTAQDALPLFEGVAAYEELTSVERVKADEYVATLKAVAEFDDVSILGDPDLFFFEATYFILFDLGASHPGPIPPPFPE